MKWLCAGRQLDLSEPLIMGIVNVTPDSFSDGGRYAGTPEAIAHGLELLEQGADILDIGGESTRPGAAEVTEQEELERVVPVVEALAKTGAVISVDTSKAGVIREAVKAGAHIINDVRALQEPGALEAAAQTNAGICLMHMQGTPATMQKNIAYGNLLQEVERFLLDRAQCAQSAGIGQERICLDYGFGFGKTVDQNFELLANTDYFARLPYPILVGLSRKSSLGAVVGRDVSDRMIASVTGALIAAQRGAGIVRVHDVAATRDAFKIWHMTVSKTHKD